MNGKIGRNMIFNMVWWSEILVVDNDIVHILEEYNHTK